MKIVLCIKQVPDTSDIKWTENNTINREGVESILNPMDLYAIDTAVKIKQKFLNSEISVVTMGPLQAKEVLERAIALGCDRGYLLSDKAFAGADTYATAKTLAKFIKEKISDFDLVICGQYASDGDTAQTGPSLASQLQIPPIANVNNVEIQNADIIVTRETETQIEKYKINSKVLLCISKGDFEPQRPKIDGFINAQKTDIEVLNASDINIELSQCGLKGSPTYVSKAFTPEIKHDGDIYKENNTKTSVEILKSKISEYKNE